MCTENEPKYGNLKYLTSLLSLRVGKPAVLLSMYVLMMRSIKFLGYRFFCKSPHKFSMSVWNPFQVVLILYTLSTKHFTKPKRYLSGVNDEKLVIKPVNVSL